MDTGLTPVVPSFGGPSSDPPHELRSLETLECYKLVERLGRGGMAEVLLAAREVEPFVHRPVVVKRLYEHFSQDRDLVQMFLDEARLLCQLDHPHIVKTYEAGVIDGQSCIAMEYLEGQPLQVVLGRANERGKLPIELAAMIVAAMLEGLHYAHGAKDESGRLLEVVHRDVSPQNVFVTSAGGVKILDFGIAKAASQAGRTEAGRVKGKAGYMAPEQANAEPIDRRADVWSAGVVLWEALTGTRLFRADSDAAAIKLTLTGDIPLASSIRELVPDELDEVLSKALRRNRAERYQSALDMQLALERWLASVGYTRSPAQISAYMHEAFAAELLDQRLLVAAHMARSDCTPPSIRSADRDSWPTAKINWDRRTTAPPPPLPQPAQAASPVSVRSPRYLWLLLLSLCVSAGVAYIVITQLLATSAAPSEAAAAVREPVAAHGDSPPASLPELKPPAAQTAATIATASAVHVVAQNVATPGALSRAVAEQASHPVHGVRRVAAPAVATTPNREPTAPASGEAPPSLRPEPAQEFGFLNIDTTPWSFVSTGGKSLGQTPLVGVKLPPGVHVLKLKNPDLGREATYTVTIEAGKTQARRIGLE